MTIQTAYDHWSKTYDTDQNLTRDLDATITQAVLETSSYHTILELGCGTGKNTPFLAQIGQVVYALDFSEGMLAKAKARVSSDRVIFKMADLTHPWPVPNPIGVQPIN